MESIHRHFIPPKQSFFLFGPRGTGKSSWVRRAYPDALWIDLLGNKSECANSLQIIHQRLWRAAGQRKISH